MSGKSLSYTDLVARLRQMVEASGGVDALAAGLGISAKHLTPVLWEVVKPGAELLEALGYVTCEYYDPKDLEGTHPWMTSQIDVLLRLLQWCQDQGIFVPHPAEVMDYLSAYPEMRPIVESGCRLAVEHFRGQAQLSLEVYVGLAAPSIALYVRQVAYYTDILQHLDALNMAVAGELAHSDGWFIIITDFCPPRED